VASAVERTIFLAGRGESTELTVLVDGLADPVDSGISTDGSVRRIDHDDFEELVDRVLVDEVRVQHTEIGALSSGSLFSEGAERTSCLLLKDTLSTGLSVYDSLSNIFLAA
jgi:hypothetical protein